MMVLNVHDWWSLFLQRYSICMAGAIVPMGVLKCSSSDKTAEIIAVPISSSASDATMGYGCKSSILPFV
jgi:hypothetical protein